MFNRIVQIVFVFVGAFLLAYGTEKFSIFLGYMAFGSGVAGCIVSRIAEDLEDVCQRIQSETNSNTRSFD